MSIYEDNENLETILEELKNCQMVEDIMNLVNKYYPSWIVYVLDKFSDDYPHLTYNWEHIVKLNNVKKAKIIIVDELNFGDNYKMMNTVCEILTKSGFLVRDKKDFIKCSVCNSVLVSSSIYDILYKINTNDKARKIQIPETWNNKCSTC
jgi:hypothetical protein